jgi:AraC-like DNA-binding protein
VTTVATNNAGALRIWRPGDFDSLELHTGTEVTHAYPRHWHDELYLCVILRGGGYLDCAGSSHFTPPGTFLIVPSGEVHANRKQACSFRCMFLAFNMLQAAVEHWTERKAAGIGLRTALIEDTQTATSFVRAHRVLEQSRSRLRRDAATLLFFHRLVAGQGMTSLPSSRDLKEGVAVRRAKEFIDENYADPVSLRDLARVAGLSPYYLHRSFCQQIGMPPHAYQVHVRVMRAKALMRKNWPLAQISSATGFADQSHFGRHFKRLIGVTPAAYFRELSKNILDRTTSPG